MARQTRRTFMQIVGGTAVAGSLLAGSANAAPGLDSVTIPDDTSETYPVMGTDKDNPTATLYGNFKCPYTQQFVQGNLLDVIDEYVESGQLNVQFRAVAYEPFPSDPSHGSSKYYISDSDPLISRAALGVWDVQPGDYWRFFQSMFDDLISGTVTLSEMKNRMAAADVGNRSEITANVDDQEYLQEVKDSTAAARAAGVTFTPTFVLGGESIAPHHDTQTLLNWIDAQLGGVSSGSDDSDSGESDGSDDSGESGDSDGSNDTGNDGGSDDSNGSDNSGDSEESGDSSNDSNDSTNQRVLTIDGTPTDGCIGYQFGVDGDVSKSTGMGASINSGDRLSGSTVTGAVGPGKDSYSITGTITSFSMTRSTPVYLDGERVDPSRLE